MIYFQGGLVKKQELKGKWVITLCWCMDFSNEKKEK